jgi:hypothetical protein
MEETKQAEAEISLIKKIMDDSRKAAVANGKHYILWGSVVTAALLANYIMVLLGVSVQYQGMMWFVLMISTAIAGGILEKREHKKRRVQTFAGKLLGTLWFASGVSMFMLGFIGTASGAYNPIFICPLISIVLGVSYFTSGAIQQIKWLQYLALGWWAGSVFTFMFPSKHTLLIFAAMILLFQLVPGIILYRKWKKEISLDAVNVV